METNRPPATTSMDPNPKTFPVLSYVMSRLPTLRHPSSPSACQPPHAAHDIEQPPPPPPSQSSASTTSDPLIEKMPHLKDPKVIAAMSAAVTEIAQTRSVLKALGERPDHETIDVAKSKLSELESDAANQLEEIALSPKEADQEADEKKARVEREMTMYRAIIQLDEMHEAYKKLLRGAEEKLMRIYDRAVSEAEAEAEEAAEEVDEEVVRVLKEAETVKAVDLSGRKLRVLPEAIGKLSLVVNLNLSSNQLQSLPDSICGLENLEEFNLSSNSLKSLPDSIGLLRKLRILNVSGNKLTALPDTICQCRSLVELDAGFNNLGYLPTNIGELTNLEKLSIQYNKIRSLPTSIGDMKSLQYLDIHFNELHSIPHSFGKLKNLVTLNLCGNFSDLKELPETFGELESLEELDLSNNQIHALPDTFGMLDKLKKFCIEQNPVFVPPVEVIKEGVENVKKFMAKRLMDLLMEEEKSKKGMNDENEAGWLKRSVSKLGGVVLTVSEYLGSPRSPLDPLLDLER